MSMPPPARADAFTAAIAESVLIHPLKYPDSGRLYTVVNLPPPGLGDRYWAVNGRNFAEWRMRCRSCDNVAMAESIGFSLSGSGDSLRLPGWRVSYNFFRTLGVRPALGRDFRPEEEQNLPERSRLTVRSDSSPGPLACGHDCVPFGSYSGRIALPRRIR